MSSALPAWPGSLTALLIVALVGVLIWERSKK